jgi:WD40 repeat protein
MAVVIDGTNGVSSPDYEVDGVTGQLYPIVSGTAKAWNWNGLTTNKEIDFTGIPSWVKRVTVMFNGVSTSGTSQVQVQLGDSGGVEITGYLAAASAFRDNLAVITANSTVGFPIQIVVATYVLSGSVTITLLDAATNTWACSYTLANSNTAVTLMGGGSKALSATLDRVRITTAGGTDNFDAGTINIIYE